MTFHSFAAAALSLCLCFVLAISAGCRADAAKPRGAAADRELFGAFDGGTFDAIVEWQLAAQPVRATDLGDHRYDGVWPDVSDQGLAEEAARVERELAQLRSLDRSGLSVDQRVDLDILSNQLALDKLDHETIRPWQHNPLFYSHTIGSGLNSLSSREFAPLDRRAENVARRLEGLPRLIEQALVQVRRGPLMKPHTQVAIGQLAGVRGLIEHELAEKFEPASAALRERIARAVPPAAAAVAELERVLADELLPAANHPWRLGPELFAKKLALSLETDLTAEEIVARAQATKAEILADMAEQARALYPPLFGQAAPAGDDKAVIRRVLEALSDDHVSPERLRDAAEENLARLDAFVQDQAIIALDSQQLLRVIWTPPHERGVAIAGLAQPGPLEARDARLPSFYLVQPLPEDWSDDVRESFLREYNNFMLEVLSIHEAIPGHFVQLYYGRREPSRVRQVHHNGPFVEGWAVYSEQVMMERGYAGAGPKPGAVRPAHLSEGVWRVKTNPEWRALAIALHRNKFWLRSTVNAILDYQMHARGMSESEALDLLMNDAFQQAGEAKGKWVRAQVTSTQLSSYFVGATAWQRLREQARARAGADYDEAAFHAEALSHGSPPVHRLPELMGWE
jgi:uncharacterized protein (DUF885 family)